MNSPTDTVTRTCPKCSEAIVGGRAHISRTVRRHLGRDCQPPQPPAGNIAAAIKASAVASNARAATRDLRRLADAGIDVEHTADEWVARRNERPDLYEALLDAMFDAHRRAS